MEINICRPIPLSNIFLNKPFIVGNIHADDLDKNQVWVHESFPENAPNISYYPNAVVGDILLNINPNMEIPELRFASWICVELTNGNLAFKGMEAIF